MAGYSKRPLSQKLGIKAGTSLYFQNMPASVLRELSSLPENVALVTSPRDNLDYIHFFAESVSDLNSHFPRLKKSLNKAGTFWISWRKGRNNTDLDENLIRELALRAGLVDVKVCAIDDIWSGLKLVYRVKDR